MRLSKLTLLEEKLTTYKSDINILSSKGRQCGKTITTNNLLIHRIISLSTIGKQIQNHNIKFALKKFRNKK